MPSSRDGRRGHLGVERPDDLGLRDRLAAADDVAVQRVLGDEGRALLGCLLRETHVGAAVAIVRLALPHHADAGQDAARLLGHGRRARQAGRLHAGEVHEARHVRRLGDDEVAGVDIGADAREVADVVAQVERGHRQARLARDEVLTRRGASGVVLLVVGQRLGVGTHDDVAVDRRRDEHALALLVWALEDDRTDQARRAVVEQVVLAAGRRDMEGRRGDHVVHMGRVDAGGVHDRARLHLALRRR